MRKTRIFIIMMVCISTGFLVSAQRIYAPHSVLSSGNWYKLSVVNPGVYKMDIPFLNSLGVSTSNLASSSIRLFGNGGTMLPEANNVERADDLVENAIGMVDGGDGIINGSDYIIFYSNGPDQWIRDSANQRFTHQKNLYSDKSFYFLNIGSNGKRIITNPVITGAAVTVNNFSERYFHELDTVNFLAGSKEWYGEELSSLPGRTLTRNFPLQLKNPVDNSPILLRSDLVARSVGNPSRFDIRINNSPVAQPTVNAVSGAQYDLFGQGVNNLATSIATQTSIDVNYSFVPGSFNAQGWINWFEVFTRRKLSMNGTDQLLFRDWASVGNNNVEFIIQNSNTATIVWEITDPLNPVIIPGIFSNGEIRFINNSTRLREYIAYNPANFLIPASVGKISNQDLHQSPATDLIIISHPNFQTEANRLADIHRLQNGLRSVVVSTEQVFNEFGGGSPDPAALRDFVKMYYDKYAASLNNKPRYLLLFGDASFDYKNRITNNSNFVPAYQNNFSLDPLSSYTSDDFFGFLDNNEDINSGLIINLLDIGIGRVPVKTAAEAKDFTDKVSNYLSKQSVGPWRNNLSFIADDEDNNLHLQDAELITTTVFNTAPVFNQQKIYLDAFHQESGAGGSSYPQAVQVSNNSIFNGTLIWNYNGHGGARRLAEETILDQQMVDNWNNPNRLPLFITATCDFAPFDNPTIQSLGENILLRPKTGAIALMTTTRVVFAFSNRVMNDNYLRFALSADANGRYRSLGDAVKDAKNFTYQSSPDITNNRKFTLLGDPALTLAFPQLKVIATKINGINTSSADTLSSAENVEIEGIVTDQQGIIINDFNGQVFPTVFDKQKSVQTIGNDPGSLPATFQVQNNILFKGNASVINGRFLFQFKVPKDINFQYGPGRLSFYVTDSIRDGKGLFTNFIVGGAGSAIGNDQEGPEIKAYLNDELFVNGGISNQDPVLIVKLSDSSGINTTNSGIGHELVATLDNDNRNFFILNDFYQADLNSYQRGTVRFQMPRLKAGPHSIRIKAWDVLNNSNENSLEFIVSKDEELELSHVLNYPNPFTTSTHFWFEHNKPGETLMVKLQVMTISGRIIKTISRSLTTDGNRSDELEWDGRDNQGDKVGRGIYLYELQVQTSANKKKAFLGKLAIL